MGEWKESKMKKFSIEIYESLNIWYSHYLSDKFIKEERCGYYFKEDYPSGYSSRVFDKPAVKRRNGTCIWKLDDKWHRVGRPACIWADGSIEYWEDGEKVK